MKAVIKCMCLPKYATIFGGGRVIYGDAKNYPPPSIGQARYQFAWPISARYHTSKYIYTDTWSFSFSPLSLWGSPARRSLSHAWSLSLSQHRGRQRRPRWGARGSAAPGNHMNLTARRCSREFGGGGLDLGWPRSGSQAVVASRMGPGGSVGGAQLVWDFFKKDSIYAGEQRTRLC